MEQDVLLANGINLIGVALLIASHTILSISESKSTYILSIIGGSIIITGSLILKSYPPVALNVFWVLISILGLLKKDSVSISQFRDYQKHTVIFIVITSSVFLLISNIYLVNLSFVDSISIATTFIYSAGYLSLIIGLISKRMYLNFCLVGFVLFVPHLVDKMQLTLLVNEFYGAIIAFFGVWKLRKQ